METSKLFKARSSCLSDIMTDPRSKSESISQTCKTYVHDWIKELPEMYNRRIEITNKYCDKGNQCEDDAIDYASTVYGWGLVSKNEVSKEDDHFTGTADLVLTNSIVDIKNSWSQKTFPLFDSEIPTKGYEMQGQAYMHLYNKELFQLVYCLSDAPEDIVEKEARSKMYQLGMSDLTVEFYIEVQKAMTYSDLPECLRIKSYTVVRDREFIVKAQERVELIRNYIKSL